MNVLEFLKDNIVFLDGGMGTLLQNAGLTPGEKPELWNISHPETVIKIHRDYFNSGSNIVSTNTFGANSLHFSEDELEKIVAAAVENAKEAKATSISKGEKFIALDVGPLGKLLKPYGDLDFEDAVEAFAKTIRLGIKYGVDLIFIETMNDSLETKAALLAAKENSSLPVFVSNAYAENGNLLSGTTPEAMVAMLEGMGADAIGVNCSFGPEQLSGVVKKILAVASVPVILKPNAGLPKSVDGATVYDVLPSYFAASVADLVAAGVRVVGGCCGTTPEYIKALSSALSGSSPCEITEKNLTVVSSYTHTVTFGKQPILIGERINPTGKKRFRQALLENDISYILKEGISQAELGVHILDVNVGLPEIDEAKMLPDVTFELQSVTDLPLQIDTSDVSAMEAALRRYNGKAMINSVNGKKESMEKIFPLVKKYGGLVVALTLDENGMPKTPEERVKIAENIIKTAKEYGISKKDIIFDTLAMTVSADDTAALVALSALKTIKKEFGCCTSLGISNISFGLPCRNAINGTFFALALEQGLSAAIMNPYSLDMLKTYHSFCALSGLDKNCEGYISFMSNLPEDVQIKDPKKSATSFDASEKAGLSGAIIKGLKEDAKKLTIELLSRVEPLDIVQSEIIPALDTVGKGFEEKRVYLPQLLMSAESAKYAFEVIKDAVIKSNTKMDKKCEIVIATVFGDIHDIGKNIVKLLLENYGFSVTDLGKDVPPSVVCDAVIKTHAPLVGLSALMTTTVPAMEETIKLLRKNAPWCKIIVGGAVLTKEYAQTIGADFYAKDAMEAVRCAESING